VFQYLETAEKANPTDPELNLLKGYMDLILAVNLPFSSPQEAIERLETYGSPDYLVDRGIALAYRNLKQYDQALQFIDNALKATPNNPELMYLKGQILEFKAIRIKIPAL
jgi:tetratricopeptide (TPR) repeat protein